MIDESIERYFSCLGNSLRLKETVIQTQTIT